MRTELYISYVFYDRDCVEVVHFEIDVLAFFDK